MFGLRHVCDDAIGDDEQDEVLAAVPVLRREVGHVLDHRREVGGSEQLDLGKASLVRLHNSCRGTKSDNIRSWEIVPDSGT